MTIYTAVTTFDNGLFGSYTSILRARKAIEYYLKEAEDIISFEDIGNYTYQFTTDKGEVYSITILTDTLDWEYDVGELDENN